MPNLRAKDNFAKGGQVYNFPALDSGMVMQAKFLSGFKGDLAEEKVKLVATRRNEQLLALGLREGVFEVYDARSTGMVSDLVRKLNKINPEDWTEATANYKIMR